MYNTGISKLLLHSGADLGFTERTTLSIESLKQGVWGPSEAIGYLIYFSTKIPCNPLLTLCMNILNLRNKLKHELLLHCVSVYV